MLAEGKQGNSLQPCLCCRPRFSQLQRLTSHPLEVPGTPCVEGESEVALHTSHDTLGVAQYFQEVSQVPWGPVVPHEDACLVFFSWHLQEGGVRSEHPGRSSLLRQ